MAKQTIPFEDFVQAAGAQHEEFITHLHDYLLENQCEYKIQQAKSGYVVSYIYQPDKRTVANYVFRKKGVMLRIYADSVSRYMEMLNQWPASMKATIEKAGPCKRMLAPDACNPRCSMGFDFVMDGVRHQKCRNGGFFFLVEDETKPHLRAMMEQEIKFRAV